MKRIVTFFLIVFLLLSSSLMVPFLAHAQDTTGRAQQDRVDSPYPQGLSTLLVTGNSTKVLIVTEGYGPLTGYSPWQDKDYWLSILQGLSNYDADWYNGIPTAQTLSSYDLVIYTAGGYWYPLEHVANALRDYHSSGKPLIVVAPDINYDWYFHSLSVGTFCKDVLHIRGVLGIMDYSAYNLYADTGHAICAGLPHDIYVPTVNSWPDAFDPMSDCQGVLTQGSIPETEFPVGSATGLPSYTPFSPMGLYGITAFPGSGLEGKVVTFGFVPCGIDATVGKSIGENVIHWLMRTPKQRLGDALQNVMKAESDLMLLVAKARSEAYAKSYLVTKDYYDDLIQILLYVMTLGLDNYVKWPNWQVSSHFQGIMDAVRNSPLLQALYHEHWIWQHQGKLTEFVTKQLLDFAGKKYVDLNFGSKSESEIASEHYNWMLDNYYDAGGLNGIKGVMQNDYNAFMATVPDNLADKPFLDMTISSLERTTSSINTILQTMKPNKVGWYSDTQCIYTTLGDTLAYRDSTYAATLEAVHNGAQTIKTASTVTAIGAIGGYVILKIASAYFTLGTTTLAVEGVLPVVAEAAGGIGVGAAGADAIATYLVGRVYAETTAATIGDMDGIKMLWEDSISVSKLTVQEVLKDPKGQIVTVSIPNIVSNADVVRVLGTATVSNLDIEATNVTMFANVYDLSGAIVAFTKSPSSGSELLQPGEVKDFAFNFTLIRSLTSQEYIAEVYASMGFTIIGPSVTSFAACSSNEYTSAVSKVTQTIQTGMINQGNVVVEPFNVPDGTCRMQCLLFYPWGRLDLHVYDENGDHVGINYENDLVEKQIAGSTYSGVDAAPQKIEIFADTSNKHLSIHIVGFQTIGEEGFALVTLRTPSLTPILDVFPTKLYLTNSINPSAKFVVGSFIVNEFGGQQPLQDVKVAISDLVDGYGKKIPSGSISVEPSSFYLPAGGFVAVTLNITLDSVKIGNYTGTICVSTGNQAIDIPIRFECVTSQYLISNSLKELQRYIKGLPSDVFCKKQPGTVQATKTLLSLEIQAVIAMMNTPCPKYYNCAMKILLSCVKPQISCWIIDAKVQKDIQNWIGWIVIDIQKLL